MVYPIVLLLHNALRWLVLGSLLAALISSYAGWLRLRPYRSSDQTLRVVATSIAHTQLLIGFYLYVISPIVKYYWSFKPSFRESPEFPFFGLIHISLMFTAIIVMTVGSSKAKRQPTAQQKFKTTAIYFTLALLLILVAIPWPFSPLAMRPWIRFLH
jgi:ABC-type Na+ efflux pump permease subunit